MNWDELEADILRVQCLMKDANFHEASEIAKNCVEALKTTSITLAPNIKTLASNCLLIHRAMSLLYSEEFRESLDIFEQVNARLAFNSASDPSDRSFQGVWDLSRDALLHSYLNASVAAEKCRMPQLTQGYLEKAIQVYREQQLTRHEAVTWHRLGKLLCRQNKHTQAGLSLNTASLLFKKCQLPVLEAESLCDLATVYSATNSTSRLSEVMEQSHFICLSLTDQPSDQRRLYNRLADLYSEQRAYPDAALCLEHVIAASRCGGDRARGLVRRGQLLRWMGERASWEKSMRDASEECELLVESPVEASEVLISIARESSEVGLYRETLEYLERAVRLCSECEGAELVMTEALEELGDVLVKQRRRADAEGRYREASLLLEKLYDENGVEIVGTRLQRVWSKYSSSLEVVGEMEGSIAENGPMLNTSLVCEASEELLDSSERQAIQSNEFETHSLVSISDLSELSCDETKLASDTPTNRSLVNKMDTSPPEESLTTPASSSPVPEDTLLPAADPPLEPTKKQTRPKLRRTRPKITHSFRGDEMSPLAENPTELTISGKGPPSSSEVSIPPQELDQNSLKSTPPTSRTCSIL